MDIFDAQPWNKGASPSPLAHSSAAAAAPPEMNDTAAVAELAEVPMWKMTWRFCAKEGGRCACPGGVARYGHSGDRRVVRLFSSVGWEIVIIL